MDSVCGDCPKNYMIRVKHAENIKFICIPRNELNLDGFLSRGKNNLSCREKCSFQFITEYLIFTAFSALQIEKSNEVKVKLCDNLSTPIDPDCFTDVIKSFWNGSSFFVRLVVEDSMDAAKAMVTADVS